MKMKVLALLLGIALVSAAGGTQARTDSRFRASAEAVAEAKNNPVLPPLLTASILSRLLHRGPILSKPCSIPKPWHGVA